MGLLLQILVIHGVICRSRRCIKVPFSLYKKYLPLSVMTKHCLSGPISPKIDSKSSLVAEYGKFLTKSVELTCAVDAAIFKCINTTPSRPSTVVRSSRPIRGRILSGQ